MAKLTFKNKQTSLGEVISSDVLTALKKPSSLDIEGYYIAPTEPVERGKPDVECSFSVELDDESADDELLDELSNADEEPAVIKRQAVHELSLTTQQLIHVRDVLGTVLNSSGQTLSEVLALKEGRQAAEVQLFSKVIDLCDAAGLPFGDEAPDFAISVSAPPELDVFQTSEDEEEG